MTKAKASILFDGEKILGLLARAVENNETPLTDFGSIKQSSEVLDGLFSALIKEYLNRIETVSGGAARKQETVQEVVGTIKRRYTAYKPSNDRSRDACMGLFGDKTHIGAGRYGDVYSATSPHDPAGALYAVKAIMIHPFSHPMLYRNVVNEIEIGRKMGEAGIGPRMHDVHWCERDGGILVMIVSDLMRHGDLATFSQTTAVTEAHVRAIRKKLRAMHAAGYTHNDVHARNILVDSNQNGSYAFYLGDFGFSTETADASAAKDEIRALGCIARLATRDRLRGILYKLVEDGTIAVDISLKSSSPSSSSQYREISQ